MPLLRNLPEPTDYADVYRAFPELMVHLIDFQKTLFRGPSPFTEGEREMIGAYTSGLNNCTYCHGSHKYTAVSFGIDEAVFEELLNDVDSAPVDDRLKPVLRYVRKLTESPSQLVEADAAAVYDAGCNDTALFHTIAVCAYFNLANRMVDGCGVEVSDKRLRDRLKPSSPDVLDRFKEELEERVAATV